MSMDIIDFAEKFISDRLYFNGFPQEPGPDPEAVSLAEACMAEAREHGFSAAVVERQAGFLVSYIHNRMVTQANNRLGGQA